MSVIHNVLNPKETGNSQGCASGTPQDDNGIITAVQARPLAHTHESDVRFAAIARWAGQAIDRRCSREDAARAIAGLAERCGAYIEDDGGGTA